MKEVVELLKRQIEREKAGSDPLNEERKEALGKILAALLECDGFVVLLAANLGGSTQCLALSEGALALEATLAALGEGLEWVKSLQPIERAAETTH